MLSNLTTRSHSPLLYESLFSMSSDIDCDGVSMCYGVKHSRLTILLKIRFLFGMSSGVRNNKYSHCMVSL